MPERLSEWVTIEQASTSPDGSGGQDVTWSALVSNVRAAVDQRTAFSSFVADQLRQDTTHIVTIPRRSDVTATMRVKWTPSWDSALSEQTLDIAAVRPHRQQPQLLLVLECEER